MQFLEDGVQTVACTITEEILDLEKIEKGVYYLCCENKDANQLCSYCTAADLHLSFCACSLLVK